MMTRLEQVIATLNNKNIIVLGAGLTGMSCLRFLHTHGLTCAVIDSRNDILDTLEFNNDYPQCQLYQGDWYFDLIKQADVILLSPGIDIEAQGIAKNINKDCQVIGDIELFCQINTKPVVAVTGSNGKSTVVSLLAHVGKALGKNIGLGGNIGVPVLNQLASDVECFVLELSSFQLERVSSLTAKGACVLNVSDDHLDRHKTLENYAEIKSRIYNHCETAVFNRQDSLTQVPSQYYVNKQVSFGIDTATAKDFGLQTVNGEYHLMQGEQVLIPLAKLPLAGLHNAVNYLAVLALGQSLSWSITEMLPHLVSFTGLAHRCQRIETNDGIHWINDSKATNVGATVAAITGLAPTLMGKKFILIAGGEGKGADFSPLKALFQQHISTLFVLGKDGDKIAELSDESQRVDSLESAVEKAKLIASKGDIVLLSPACASLDMFRNYEERGQVFVNAIHNNMQEAS
ncbi:UDP-N-acetylmuramoyl-L-alanine--D-glutamate ligase [Thalassotalea profundi]|uniref:UDP-N-acetylmuramoylalanine--D-glutamate ligase n=1 Tax=Thalassotalea profundi TaxID=2036687 RepID=A0ABQ3IWS9_9GAMM|nr:UDP-N-acetylmuramoyl-L-alanine--D-glutamate ligase [Thalassotalea profundi]GHE95161.1 UDP-N-acetylmuramoylalanine--D-glutamate ligase [Thalassotalea profundi]